ncbi:PLP-dependent transferase [Epithele typhae]|uniref:PLP-dependent transferase n=1 Tax=Epithele typhae TaxID=378194 RepID=UPI00200770FE|nr:PLP-dependent transferase [Epithele typhae]KAH9945380.1 PLP-dependent transferase [Epithele typhae]
MPTPAHKPGPGESYDPRSEPPPFGHELKAYFGLDEEYVNLNHGSYGSIPLPVLFAAGENALGIERNPDRFMRLEGAPLLNKAREAVAKIVNADVDDVVFVPNATVALNAVLRNFEWRDGDIIVGASTTYEAVSKTMQYLADRADPPRPTVAAVELIFPMAHTDIVAAFHTKIQALKAEHPNIRFTDVPPISPGHSPEPAKRQNKIVAVIDSIVSQPGVYLPWKEMAAVCREEGVWSVIDAAHSIGQELDINLSESKPDYWLSNCHKWLFAKRACAMLYVPKRNQYMMKSSLPTSHGYVSPEDPRFKEVGTNFVEQFQWTGTSDFTPYLSVHDAIAFRTWIGGETAINTYCRQLAIDGAKRLAELMGTSVMDQSGELTLSMSNVQLPLPVESEPGEIYKPEVKNKIMEFLMEKLLLEWKVYASLHFYTGGWWCRCSAQVFTEMADFEYLAKACTELCQEVKEKMLPRKVSVTRYFVV